MLFRARWRKTPTQWPDHRSRIAHSVILNTIRFYPPWVVSYPQWVLAIFLPALKPMFRTASRACHRPCHCACHGDRDGDRPEAARPDKSETEEPRYEPAPAGNFARLASPKLWEASTYPHRVASHTAPANAVSLTSLLAYLDPKQERRDEPKPNPSSSFATATFFKTTASDPTARTSDRTLN